MAGRREVSAPCRLLHTIPSASAQEAQEAEGLNKADNRGADCPPEKPGSDTSRQTQVQKSRERHQLPFSTMLDSCLGTAGQVSQPSKFKFEGFRGGRAPFLNSCLVRDQRCSCPCAAI